MCWCLTGPGGGHGVQVPGDEGGVAAPAEGDQVPGVGGHLTAEHHTGVESHSVQHLGPGLTSRGI